MLETTQRGVAASLQLLLSLALPAAGSPAKSDRGPALVSHVENADGRVLQSRKADAPINPASVVKVATSLWALGRLGAEHRFETEFGIAGSLDPSTGVLEGDLLVRGGGDPDFHVENAYLVARELNRLGLRVVRGDVRVDDAFWIGWEGGSEKREKDPGKRSRAMARRLRDALDPSRWSDGTRDGIREFRERRKLGDEALPAVVVRGTAGRRAGRASSRSLIVHRSNPLHRTLKRFNSFSNNDIERLGAELPAIDVLAAELAAAWATPRSRIRFSTLSGLGTNRLAPRDVVRLLRDLKASCERHGLTVRDILPVAGCDPGTLESFVALVEGDTAGSLVAKTGTLTTTDGGVAVLAGFVETGRGELVFGVAAPRSGGRLRRARAAQERWLLELIAANDGPRPVACGAPLGFSDDEVRVVPTEAPE